MFEQTWTTVPAMVMEGYRVASGPTRFYPYGSLARQKPLFKARGLDLDGYFEGTLNLSLKPHTFEMIHPRFTFPGIAWTDLHPPETFSFSACRVEFAGAAYDGWVYFPHPETKIRNFQDPSLLEVIARPIPGLAYGSRVRVSVDPAEVRILGSGEARQ